ncbi:MAG TPA: hypothetical protein VJ835_01925 [Fimbriimonadaceae bacterium]|nr:hypothetical protein [Fimbriimonadaceae bacterium]
MRILLPSMAALLCIGCSSGPAELAEPSTTPTNARVTVSTPEKIDPPAFDERTTLRMFRRGDEVRVGDNIDSALRVFREEKNAYQVSELPAGWKDQAYTCRGWDNGASGFAAIVFDEKVALAMYHEERATETRLQEIVGDYDRALSPEPTTVTGTRVRYWFWDEGGQRFMICAVQLPVEGLSITTALGGQKLMDILRMNPVAADRDRQSADQIFLDAAKPR